MIIRKIHPKDNKTLEKIIKDTIIEYNLPKVGTAYEDKDTLAMFEAYQDANATYFVLEIDNKVIGGSGIKLLKGSNGNVCELQKLYLIPEARGKGYGKQLFDACITAAKKLGYNQCYLESDPSMKKAIAIYEKNGFKHLKQAMGNTGHNACGVFMIKDL